MKVLKNSRNLAEKLPEHLRPYATLLECFGKMVESCFSAKELHPDFEAHIDEYCVAVHQVRNLFGMSISPKIHINMDHIKPWCQKFKVPLGKFSEQETESTHYEFHKLWSSRFLVKDPNAPSFLSKLLKAVLAFNERNV